MKVLEDHVRYDENDAGGKDYEALWRIDYILSSLKDLQTQIEDDPASVDDKVYNMIEDVYFRLD